MEALVNGTWLSNLLNFKLIDWKVKIILIK